MLDSEHIRRALNAHGNHEIPLKPSDFQLLPEMLAGPDGVSEDNKPATVKFSKEYGERLVVVEEQRVFVRKGHMPLTIIRPDLTDSEILIGVRRRQSYPSVRKRRKTV